MAEEAVTRLERKFKKIGTQFRWFGIAFFLVGVMLAIIEASGGVVILAIGLLAAIQGAIIEYYFSSNID